jgi:hypothetical protein
LANEPASGVEVHLTDGTKHEHTPGTTSDREESMDRIFKQLAEGAGLGLLIGAVILWISFGMAALG